MTDFTRVQPGQVNGGGSDIALFLKLMGGEVLTAFENLTLFKPHQRIRNITAGKSAAFPATGRLSARYVTPGVTQTGQAMNHNEVVIGLDGEIIADGFVASIDEAMAHWDVRAPITAQMGDALAQAYDKNVARNIVLAARSANVVTGEAGGSTVTNAAIHTDASVLAAAYFTAAQALDEKFVPATGRVSALRPAQFYLAAQKTDLLNTQWAGANGALKDGTIYGLAGIPIMKSNNVPGSDDSANANIPTAYRANYSTTRGVIWTPDAVGTVELLSLKSEAEYQMRERGWYMVSSYACGHGVLRPPCAVELKNA